MNVLLIFTKKDTKAILFIFVLSVCSCQLMNIFLEPYKLDEPVAWETFQSEIKPISIIYPQDWLTFDLPQGNHGDKDVIAYMSPFKYEYPYVTILYREMRQPSLDDVAAWGERRITTPTYKSTSLGKINIRGLEALLRNFYYTNKPRMDYFCHHIYLADKNDAYIIEMCVDEKNKSNQVQSIFKDMIQSISLN